jgi:hypothetical protein
MSEDDVYITAFTPADGGSAVTVVVQPGEPPAVVQSEKSKRVCQGVTVARLSGRRCFDPDSSTTSTILDGKGRIYTITTTANPLDEQLYQQFVDSFKPLG